MLEVAVELITKGKSKVFNVLFVAAISLAIFGLGFWQIWEAHASQSWPTVTGQIRTSRVLNFKVLTQSYYYPDVLYTYTVDGEKYANNQLALALDTPSINYRQISNTVASYPPNAVVIVHYNPDYPRHSVLETRDVSWLSIMFLVGGVLGLLVAAVAAWTS